MTCKCEEVCYRLNARDEIVFVNEGWDVFALDNNSKHLTAEHVLGRPLWEFITEHTTQLLYQAILERVRSGRPVHFVFRCDAPDRRRLLKMEVSLVPDGLTQYRVVTLQAEERKPQPLLDPYRAHTEDLLRMCSWCKKVDAAGRWAEVEEAVALLGLFESLTLPNVTHAICESCYAYMVATLGDEGESARNDTLTWDHHSVGGRGVLHHVE